MIKVYNYINKYNKCYICNNKLNYMFGRNNVYPKQSVIGYHFSLITRFNNKIVDNYSCKVDLNMDKNFISVSFYKDKEIMNYIPLSLIDSYHNVTLNKNFYIFKYCPSCSKYSSKSSKINLDYDCASFGKINTNSEFMCINYQDKEIQIHQNYDSNQTSLIFNGKSHHLPILKKTKKYKDYVEKINKYVLLI